MTVCPDDACGSATSVRPTSKGSLTGSLLDWISVVASSAVTSSSLSHNGVVPQLPVATSESGRACSPPCAARPLLNESVESARKRPNAAADTSASAIRMDGRSARPHVSWMRGIMRPNRRAACVMFARMCGNQPTLLLPRARCLARAPCAALSVCQCSMQIRPRTASGGHLRALYTYKAVRPRTIAALVQLGRGGRDEKPPGYSRSPGGTIALSSLA